MLQAVLRRTAYNTVNIKNTRPRPFGQEYYMNRITVIGYLAKTVEVKTLNNEKATVVANTSLCDTQTIGTRKNEVWMNLEGYGTVVDQMTAFDKKSLVEVDAIIQRNSGYAGKDGAIGASMTLKVLSMKTYVPKAKRDAAAHDEVPAEMEESLH